MARRVIITCDRCGKQFTPERVEDRNLKLTDYEEDLYDICPKCQKSLEKWFDDSQETVLKHKIDEVIKIMEKKAQVNDREWEQYSDDQNYYAVAVYECIDLLREVVDE